MASGRRRRPTKGVRAGGIGLEGAAHRGGAGGGIFPGAPLAPRRGGAGGAPALTGRPLRGLSEEGDELGGVSVLRGGDV